MFIHRFFNLFCFPLYVCLSSCARCLFPSKNIITTNWDLRRQTFFFLLCKYMIFWSFLSFFFQGRVAWNMTMTSHIIIRYFSHDWQPTAQLPTNCLTASTLENQHCEACLCSGLCEEKNHSYCFSIFLYRGLMRLTLRTPTAREWESICQFLPVIPLINQKNASSVYVQPEGVQSTLPSPRGNGSRSAGGRCASHPQPI